MSGWIIFQSEKLASVGQFSVGVDTLVAKPAIEQQEECVAQRCGLLDSEFTDMSQCLIIMPGCWPLLAGCCFVNAYLFLYAKLEQV